MAEEIQDVDLNEDEKQLLRELLCEDEQYLTEFGKQRRHFIKQVLGTGGALLAGQLLGEQSVFAEVSEFSLENIPDQNIENGVAIHFKHAHNVGFTDDELKEIILQATAYCGAPAGNHATHEAEEAFKEMANEGVKPR